MYEQILELWKGYLAKHAPTWSTEDSRHALSAEVCERLAQLDIILAYLRASLAAVAPDPTKARRNMEWVASAAPCLDTGEITQAEFAAGFERSSREELDVNVRAWYEIRLFTETFYFFAWRLREVVNGGGGVEFVGVRRIQAKGVRDVRNVLIEHPEHGKPSANYQQSLTVTDAGPVLKSSTIVVRGASGQVDPDDASLDRGLFINAEELRRELEACLKDALGADWEM